MPSFLSPRSRRSTALLATLSCGALALAAPAAHATTASEVVNAGSLNFINSTPANLVFPATTLDGTDQVKSQTQPFDVSDASGSGSGWSISATSTTFTAGVHTLSTSATTIPSAPTDTCDVPGTCSLATNGVSYPYTLPAAAVAPTATKMFNAAANTGQGDQTVTPSWSLSVPATTWAGGAGTPYSSTWTLTLVSGP